MNLPELPSAAGSRMKEPPHLCFWRGSEAPGALLSLPPGSAHPSEFRFGQTLAFPQGFVVRLSGEGRGERHPLLSCSDAHAFRPASASFLNSLSPPSA